MLFERDIPYRNFRLAVVGQGSQGGRPFRSSFEILENCLALASFTPLIFTDSNVAESGSLRSAVIAANSNFDDADTITLQAGTYVLAVSGTL